MTYRIPVGNRCNQLLTTINGNHLEKELKEKGPEVCVARDFYILSKKI